MATRMKAKDYQKELEDLTVKLGVIKARIQMRLLTLCKQHPDVIVGHMNDTDIKANSIGNSSYISRMNVEDCIATIDKIEKYLEAQHPHKQTTIEGF
jgi:hypothetical protein